MKFGSHAQIYEDLVLLRPFRHVHQGFYIDVGAQDPNVHSVTKLFYDRGWSGINIEPVSYWFDQLVKDRPRDINLRLAAGATGGETVLYEIPDTGLSTIMTSLAERHRQAGWTYRTTSVTTQPLSEICHRYVKGEIHFLKVDAEGSESMVLAGCDFARYRPWIILIEATEPLSDVQAYVESESILLTAEYEFAGTDGLNRYYVAREHVDLKGPVLTGTRTAYRRDRLRRGLLRLPLVPRIVR
jgi:FkbM family methyltransferase